MPKYWIFKSPNLPGWYACVRVPNSQFIEDWKYVDTFIQAKNIVWNMITGDSVWRKLQP